MDTPISWRMIYAVLWKNFKKLTLYWIDEIRNSNQYRDPRYINPNMRVN